MSTRQQLHDHLMANMPEGIEHDCELCHISTDSPEGGASSMTTYTAEDVQAAVDLAVADLVAQVAALESAAQSSQIHAQVAQVAAEYEAQIEGLQAKLDTLALEKQVAVDALDSYKAEIKALADAAAHEAEVAARTESRLARVKEVASFPQDYLEENTARFAAMSDEDFETTLRDWAAVSSKPAVDAGIPKTALTASRESVSTDTGRSLLREMMQASLTGEDPRTL